MYRIIYIGTMQRNTYYLLTGIIAMSVAVFLYVAIDRAAPLLIQIALPVGVVLFYLVKRSVTEPIGDERTNYITQKAAVATLQVFWVVFFVLSIGWIIFDPGLRLSMMQLFGVIPPNRGVFIIVGMEVRPFPPGFVMLFLLCLMIILYAGFRMYYARKYGDWERDEE
jgi:uncharacterized membrane protein